MSVTFRQLEAFAAVTETGSFTGAAKQLDISQVAISRHISALEAACGKVLFDRQPGTVNRLNDDGTRFLREALEILSRGKAVGYRAANKKPSEIQVRVGADSLLLDTFFRPRSPALELNGIPISIQFEETQLHDDDMHAVMKAKKLDLLFFALPVEEIKADAAKLVATHEASLFATPELAESWSKVKEAQPLPVLMPRTQPRTEQAMRNVLDRQKISPYKVVANVSPQGVLEALQLGTGAGITACHRVQHLVNAGILVELSDIFERVLVGRYVMSSETTSVAADRVKSALSALIMDIQARRSSAAS